jgi:hypothetical protein
MKSSLLSKVIGKDKQGESKPKSEDVYGLAQESFIADRPRAWYRKHWSTDELKKTWPHLNSEQVIGLINPSSNHASIKMQIMYASQCTLVALVIILPSRGTGWQLERCVYPV